MGEPVAEKDASCVPNRATEAAATVEDGTLQQPSASEKTQTGGAQLPAPPNAMAASCQAVTRRDGGGRPDSVTSSWASAPARPFAVDTTAEAACTLSAPASTAKAAAAAGGGSGAVAASQSIAAESGGVLVEATKASVDQP